MGLDQEGRGGGRRPQVLLVVRTVGFKKSRGEILMHERFEQIFEFRGISSMGGVSPVHLIGIYETVTTSQLDVV